MDARAELLRKQDREHRPTAELIKRAWRITDKAEQARVVAEIRELRKRYAGTAAEFKAPNGKDSLLLDVLGEEKGKEAWYAVRTGGFKRWFGDWERAARIEEIEGIQAKTYALKDPMQKTAAKKMFAGFAAVEKSFVTDFFESKDARKKPRTVSREANNVRSAALSVSFSGKTVGGLRGFLTYKNANLVSDAREIFENSHYAYSSNYLITEPRADGSIHKEHSNIEAYHHFVNKVTVGGTTYYVRFTVHEEQKSTGKLHAAHISAVEIIDEKSRESIRSLLGKNQGGTAQPAYDHSLAEFLGSVKPDSVSKVVDVNGEPLPVFHGTNAVFDTFDPAKSGSKSRTGAPEGTFFFTNREDVAESYTVEWQGDWSSKKYENARVMPAFLNVRKPLKASAKGNSWQDIGYRGEYYDINELAGHAKNSGKHDGLVVNNVMDKGRGNVDYKGKKYGSTYAAFEPSQIKSATGNAGTFGGETGSIYFSDAFHGSPHRFERFDSSRMGTGEGSQAKGWGHYCASKKEVAEWYRTKLSLRVGAEIYVDGAKAATIGIHDSDLADLYFAAMTGELDHHIRLLEEDMADAIREDNITEAAQRQRTLEKAKALKGKKVELKSGQLYKVDIPGDEGMLDWDRPLGEQPEPVKERLAGIKERLPENAAADLDGDWGLLLGKELSGEEFYGTLASIAGSDRQASLLLNGIGIKGIRYLGGSDLADGEGSHNYVIFDDSDIEITQTFYSEAFRDAGLEEFVNSYPEVVREAARFGSGAEMAEHYADYNAMPDEVYEKARALGYFDALARAAKEGDAGQATNAIAGVSAKKAAVALAAYGVGAAHAREAAGLARQGDWQEAVRLLERQGVPRIDAETYADTAKLFSRPEMLWLEKSARAAGDAVLPETQERESDGDDGEKFNGLREGVRDYGSEVMREAAGTMTGVLETGESGVVTHRQYGDITVDAGEAATKSFGLKHIINERNADGKTVDEITALLMLLHETLREGTKTRDIHFKSKPSHRGRMEIEYRGIVAIVSKQRNQGDSEQWLLTGFDDTKNKKEATEAIRTVIARYGRSPEFSGFRKQVGAVVSSLSTESLDSGEKSSAKEPVRLGAEPSSAVLKFFDTLVDAAKEIHPDRAVEEDIEAQRTKIAGEPEAGEGSGEGQATLILLTGRSVGQAGKTVSPPPVTTGSLSLST